MKRFLPVTLALALGAREADARWWDATQAPGSLVGVSVEVNGRGAPLYASPDGSDRWYLEARAGASYAVVLANRTGERLGVVLAVDGLNAISGERESGRMYVLGPWERTTIRGWRTSLSDVRRFTFVDERSSYAARTGKANSKMGWIEAAVYRERRRHVSRPWWDEEAWRSEERERAAEGAPAPVAPPAGEPPSGEPPAADDAADAKAEGMTAGRSRTHRDRGSFPGTGWGPRAEDPAVVVSFDPEERPADRVTLRYEYRSGLVALGVLPRPWPPRDRLRERDRADSGFARPPAW